MKLPVYCFLFGNQLTSKWHRLLCHSLVLYIFMAAIVSGAGNIFFDDQFKHRLSFFSYLRVLFINYQALQSNTLFKGLWAVILGGSSGFGFASVEKLARHGMNIALLYRETAGFEKQLKPKFEQIAQSNNVSILPFNINALEEGGRQKFLSAFMQKINTTNCVKLLLHSIARGNLKPVISTNKKDIITTEDIAYTSYAMSNSLLDWVRLLTGENLFCDDARVVGLTSDGAHKYWEGYSAVSIAKASLQSLATYMAVEFGKLGIKTNLIQAGITTTPSLKKIPGSDKLMQFAQTSNPLGRITTPEDVANVIYLLCTPEAAWINGSVIHVDGGEHCL